MGLTINSTSEAIPLVKWADTFSIIGDPMHHANLEVYLD